MDKYAKYAYALNIIEIILILGFTSSFTVLKLENPNALSGFTTSTLPTITQISYSNALVENQWNSSYKLTPTSQWTQQTTIIAGFPNLNISMTGYIVGCKSIYHINGSIPIETIYYSNGNSTNIIDWSC